jgi:hypothetical protein
MICWHTVHILIIYSVHILPCLNLFKNVDGNIVSLLHILKQLSITFSNRHTHSRSIKSLLNKRRRRRKIVDFTLLSSLSLFFSSVVGPVQMIMQHKLILSLDVCHRTTISDLTNVFFYLICVYIYIYRNCNDLVMLFFTQSFSSSYCSIFQKMYSW